MRSAVDGHIVLGLPEELRVVQDVRVQIGSHLSGPIKKSDCRTIRLREGWLFVGHPDLVHSGASANIYSLRLHFYMALQDFEEKDETNIPKTIGALDTNSTMTDLRKKRELVQHKETEQNNV